MTILLVYSSVKLYKKDKLDSTENTNAEKEQVLPVKT